MSIVWWSSEPGDLWNDSKEPAGFRVLRTRTGDSWGFSAIHLESSTLIKTFANVPDVPEERKRAAKLARGACEEHLATMATVPKTNRSRWRKSSAAP